MKKMCLAAMLIPLFVMTVAAIAGVLDTTFGLAGTGMVITEIGHSYEQANDVAVDADESIVAVGTAGPASTSGDSSPNGDIALVRYSEIGHAFLSVVSDLGGNETADALAIDTAGRVVVAGTTNNTCGGTCDHGDDFFVARYTSSGALDLSFAGGKGWRQIDFGSNSDVATGIAIDSLGRIIVGGTTLVHHNAGDYHVIALARLLPNGDLDTTFNVTGMKSVSLGSRVDVAVNSLVIHESGGLVLAGRVGFSPAVIRLQEIGDPYVYFGGDGVASISGCISGEFQDLAIDDWQRIIATGSCNADPSGVAILVSRFLSNGDLDGGFGPGGGFFHFGAGNFQRGADVRVDAGGRVTVAGWVQQFGDVNFLVFRLQADGFLDPHFGNAGTGWTATDFGGSSQAQALTIDRKGRYIAAGRTFNLTTGNYDFALARYLGDHQDFAATAAPITVAPGSAASTAVTVISIDGFNELLKFGLYGTNAGGPLPAGFSYTGTLNILPVASGSTTETLTFAVDSSVAPGTYTFWLIDERFVDHAAPVVVNVVTSVPLIEDTIARYTSNGYVTGPVAHVLLTMLQTAQSFAHEGRIAAASNKYAALISYIEAQAGHRISTSAEENGVTFNPAEVLISSVADLNRQLTN